MRGNATRHFGSRLLAVTLLGFVALAPGSSFAEGPLAGKIIALDAGHGGTELGATYPANAGWSGRIYEKDVNLATVYALKHKLETDGGAKVVLTREGDETIGSRRERVDIALSKCAALDVDGDGAADNRKCDALVSVHHNGSTDPAYDGLLVIYNEKQDLALAKAVHDALRDGLTYPPDRSLCDGYQSNDEGLTKGGYGMTVYGNLVSIITEAWYLTNRCEGEYWLASAEARIAEEAKALYAGLVKYFGSPGGKKGR